MGDYPALGVNGEGRITPIIPGCQVNYTVIGKDGKTILHDHIFRTPAGTEGGRAAGYGIGGGTYMTCPDQNRIVDLMTADGKILPKNTQTQIGTVEGLVADWSRVVTEEGEQLQTVCTFYYNRLYLFCSSSVLANRPSSFDEGSLWTFCFNQPIILVSRISNSGT